MRNPSPGLPPRAYRVLVLAFVVLGAPTAVAQRDGGVVNTTEGFAPTLPQGFALEDRTGGGPFNQPVAVALAPDGRMFVAEKDGRVWVVRDGVRQAVPLLDLSGEVQSDVERGLLGMALDPRFDQNRQIYFSYTVDHDRLGTDSVRTDAFARVTRYVVVDGSRDTVDPASRHVLLGSTFEAGIPACFVSHAPAMLAFGSDGTLLVGTGDAASFGQADAGGLYPNCFGPGRLDISEDIGAFRAQRLESLAGKILRVDPETGFGLPSNPFYTGDSTANASRVWALGVRNSFRFAVRPGGSADPDDGRPGTLVAGDVGWQFWEEMNVIRGGENFGWPCWEGPAPEPRYQAATPNTNGCAGLPTPVLPLAYWHHAQPVFSVPPGLRGRSIIGGAFVAGPRYPEEYRGRYLFGDFVMGWMATATFDDADNLEGIEVLTPNMGAVVQTVYDSTSQALYFVNIGTGRIERLRHASESGNQPPIASITADTTVGHPPFSVRFSAAGSVDPDRDSLSVLWNFGDGWTGQGLEVEHVYTIRGDYDVTATVRDSFHTDVAGLQISVVGEPPSLAIVEPVDGAAAPPGTTVPLLADAVDPDGTPVIVKWRVDQVHNDHEHFEVFRADGPSAQFRMPDHGEPGDVVYYRIVASAIDQTGHESAEVRELRVEEAREVDVVPEATLIARVTNPIGNGNPSMEVVRDGVRPPRDSSDPLLQFDTFDGTGADEDWVGIEVPGEERFRRIDFQEGIESEDGGWFDNLRVEVRRSGQWVEPSFQHVLPVYRGADGVSFDAYTLVFTETPGDAVRLIGEGGGAWRYVSVAELRAYALRESSLPPPWTAFDVGLSVDGSASQSAGVFALAGAGGLGPVHDSFRYVYRALDDDGTLTARLRSMRGAGSLAGLAVRTSLADSSAHAALLVSDGRSYLRTRAEAGAGAAEAAAHTGTGPPLWLRLQRSGPVVSAYTSSDGVRWSPAGAAAVAAGVRAYAGLVVAGREGRRAVAEFDDVSFAPGPDGALPEPWTFVAVGAAPAGAGATFSDGVFTVAGAGSAGGQADAIHFMQQPVPGRGSITARLEEMVAEGTGAEVGLMLRGGLDAHAPFAFLHATEGGVRLRHRTTLRGGASDTPVTRSPAAVWMRLEWENDAVLASSSLDGTAWMPIGGASVALGSSIHAGLVAARPAIGRQAGASATFSSVLVDAGAGLAAAAAAASAVAGAPFGVAVRPNPAGPRATIDVSVERAGRVTVEVLDVLGRRVLLHAIDAAGPARYALPLDASALPAGSYVARAVDDGGAQVTAMFAIGR